jgi:hypothetical protein
LLPFPPLKSTNDSVSTWGNPPALPGDPRSLTVPGVNESLQPVNRSKFTGEEAFGERCKKLKSYSMGLQVSSGLDSEVQEKGSVWPDTESFGYGISGIGPAA